MVGNVTIHGQIAGTATFDGAKISAVVTIAPPINATVVFGKSGVAIHNLLTGRDDLDAHPKESITDLTISDSPEFADTQITTLQSDATGGDIAAVEATWLGATAKSVLSYLQKLVSKVFAIDSRVAVLEDNLIVEVENNVDVLSIIISNDKNGNQLLLPSGYYRLQIIAKNGSNAGVGNINSVWINGIDSNEILFYNSLASGKYARGINFAGGLAFFNRYIDFIIKNNCISYVGGGAGVTDFSIAPPSGGSNGIWGCSKIDNRLNTITSLEIVCANKSLDIKSGHQVTLTKIK